MGIKQQSEKVKNIGYRYIVEDYTAFLEDKRASSESTFKNYRGDLKQFFMEVFNLEPQHITVEHLSGLTGNNIIEYRNLLRDKYSSPKTVNRKINALRSFFKYMETDYPEVRSAVFNKVKKIKEVGQKGWGILTYEEVMEMINLSKTYEDSQELPLLIELAFKTCIRLGALLELTWADIHLHHEHGKDIYVIEVVDKGEDHRKAISDDVMSRINLLKQTDDINERIFKSLYDKKVGEYIKQLCKDMGIDPRRKIRFHSLKKAGINFVYDATGDIMMAQKQGNHKDASTTINSYMAHKEDLTSMPSYSLGEDIDLSPLKELTKDDLLNLIDGCSATAKLEMLRRMNTDKN